MIEMIKIIELRRDGDTQMRAGLDEETIQSYAEFMRLGDHFPPIAVTHDGSDYWLTDGFHRVAAALEAGKAEIAATVWSGDKSEAQWRSYAANSTHAKERSRADLMRAIDSVLKHTNGASMSDRQIADYLKTTQRALVAGRRLHLESTGEINQSVKRHGADGRTIHTANIGIRPAAAVAVAAALVPQVFSINDRVLHISSGRVGTIRDINGLYPGKALVNYSAADGGHGTSHRYALDELALVNRDAVSPNQLQVKLTSEEVTVAFETNDAESKIATFQTGQQVITRTSHPGVVVSQNGGMVRVQEHGGVRSHHAVDLVLDGWAISRSLALESVLMETYVSESVRLIAPTLAYVLAVADGWSRDVSAVDFRARIDILTTFLNDLKP